ncbi:MAG: MurR/RpiR family transcriptional regulator [Acidobacteria bacterium]|nr:MurR/RpiR family transcriptional regulator [Acidobacteriota bacterium]
MPSSRDADVRDLLLREYPGLSPQQKLVADFLIEHFQDAPFLSVPEVSRQSGASEATVVRLAQRLGFDGFSGLKTRLLQGVRDRVRRRPAVPAAAELFAREPQDETLTAVALLEVENIRQTVAEIGGERLKEAATTLFRADQVFTFGMGISSFLAELWAYLLSEVGLRATALSTRFSSPLEQLVTARPSDLLFVFSFPPYSRATIDMAEDAARRGLAVVALTDRRSAPVARFARVVLPVRTQNVLHTNATAAVVVVLNALATEIARADRRRAAAAVTRITEILSQHDAIWKDQET